MEKKETEEVFSEFDIDEKEDEGLGWYASFSDEDVERVRREINRNRNIKIAVVAFAIVAVLAVVFFFVRPYLSGGIVVAPQETPIPEETTSETGVGEVKPGEVKTPVLDSIENPIEVTPGQVATYVDGNMFVTTESFSLNTEIPGSSVVPVSSGQCVVTNPQDFCYSGSIVTQGGEEAEVYFLKDAARSRLFENPVSYTGKEILNTVASGTLVTKILDTQESTLFAVVFEDMSGYMVNLDKISDKEAFVGGLTAGAPLAEGA